MKIAYSEDLYGIKINDINVISGNYFTDIFNIYNKKKEYIKQVVRISVNGQYYQYIGNIDDLYNIQEYLLLAVPIKINYMQIYLINKNIDEHIDIILYSLNKIYYLYPYIDNNKVIYDDKLELQQYNNILIQYADILKSIKQSRQLLNQL